MGQVGGEGEVEGEMMDLMREGLWWALLPRTGLCRPPPRHFHVGFGESRTLSARWSRV